MKRDCSCPQARHQHGTYIAYKYDKCRCRRCRNAWAAYARRRRTRRYIAGGPLLVDGVGTARRLQALAVNGWSSTDIADEIGVTNGVVRAWREQRKPTVTLRTHARIVEIYNSHWDQPGPGPHAARIRTIATKKGWQPPMFWDDDTIDIPTVLHAVPEADVIPPGSDFPDPILLAPTRSKRCSTALKVDEMAVARAVAGNSVRLNRAEVSDAVVTMTGMGKSAKEIAERLGITQRSVVRHRAAARRKEAA